MLKLSRRQLAKYAADQIEINADTKELAQQLGSVLVSTKKSNQWPQLIEDIAYELESRGLWAGALATTAFPISDMLKKELEAFIKNSAKVESVSITEVIDSSVIGGVRLDTSKRSWDQTLKRRLIEIREAF